MFSRAAAMSRIHPILRTAGILAALAMAISGCGGPGKLAALRRGEVGAALSMSGADAVSDEVDRILKEQPQTITVEDPSGQEVIIMKAVRDEDGEMVAHDVIEAARVTARFRNVAERHGRVDLSFDITVPEGMRDSRWQLRFRPSVHVLGDTIHLDPVLITGEGYRKSQLRGYQLYERFLRSIEQDTTVFIRRRQLEVFLQRNIPEVYAFRSDSTLVDEDALERILAARDGLLSPLGVSKGEAVEHYTYRIARWINRRRIAMTERRRSSYIKAPIVSEGIRLDTVLRSSAGDFIYRYTTSIETRPKLRKADVVLSGDIWEQDSRIYDMPGSEPLTFYISSLSSFADGTERFLTRTVSRRVEASTACYVEFLPGRSDIVDTLGNNRGETGRIRDNLREVLSNRDLVLDSVIVTASASPEGRNEANRALAQRRSEAVSRYFSAYVERCRDSLSRSGFAIGEDGQIERTPSVQIRFLARNRGEDWDMLDALVRSDAVLTQAQKEQYTSLRDIPDPDARERQMQALPSYRHLREALYPRLRTVRFDFHLHRRGMVQDTVVTTVPDTVYMEGVQAIRDRDFERAVTLLRPYHDYNAAVAFCCMDYNESALEILRDLERTAQVSYLLAVVHARKGETQQAVQCYMDACEADASYVHRGNLDPEISALVKGYGLNREEGAVQ